MKRQLAKQSSVHERSRMIAEARA